MAEYLFCYNGKDTQIPLWMKGTWSKKELSPMFTDGEHYWIILCLGDGSGDGGDDNDGVDDDVGDDENANNYQPWSASYIPGLC